MDGVKKIKVLLADKNLSSDFKAIAQKVYNGERISEEDGLLLYEKGDLSFVGTLANFVREREHGDKTYFNRNFHLEPTNVCLYTCTFCSYSRLIKKREEGWEYSLEDMMDIIKKYEGEEEGREVRTWFHNSTA